MDARLKRIGIDIGGTFTDLVLWDDDADSVVIHKRPSTPENPSIAGLEGVRELCEISGTNLSDIDLLFHGTTVATNIILEHNGAKVGLITTKGFRDVLHIGRKNRPYNFSHYQDVPRQSRPIVRRQNRRPVTERMTAPNGDVAIPLDEDEVRLAARDLRDAGVEAVAVCCLFSFLNPAHENRIREIIADEHPSAYISLSHEIIPLYREYERFSTTALNAYVGPKTANYVADFSNALTSQGLKSDLHLMTSAGGVVGTKGAQMRPASLLLSGPVGALIAGIEVGKLIGDSNVITLDVGGTSADIGVAPNGEFRMRHLLDTKIGDYDAMLPMVDIDTIGAGGGSIAYVDDGGMFRVGPQSAGARPGPACYGHGGTKATVTDALVTLGWFRPDALRASGLNIDIKVARNVIERDIASILNLTIEDAAAGIFNVIVNNMVEAIRVNSVSKGYDPREFALIAYGGAGAAFAIEVARQLDVPKVIIPPRPGVGAAAGLLNTDLKHDYMGTAWQDLSRPDSDRLTKIYEQLIKQAVDQLSEDGFQPTACEIRLQADCRYKGQGYEITVDTPDLPIDQHWIDTVVNAFHAEHEKLYLRHFDDKPVQLVNARVSGTGPLPPLSFPKIQSGSEDPTAKAIKVHQSIYMPEETGLNSYNAPVIDRAQLRSGNRIVGPAIIEQEDTTTILMSGSNLMVDTFGNLIVSFGGQKR